MNLNKEFVYKILCVFSVPE